MVKKIILWVVGAFLTLSTGYYIVCKIINTTNPYTKLVDSIFAFIGNMFLWLANHWLAIVIVALIAVALWFVYYFIKKNKEKDLWEKTK